MTDILTEAGAARAVLLASFEDYLVKQRGLSARTSITRCGSLTGSSIIASVKARSVSRTFAPPMSSALSSMFWQRDAATKQLRRMFASSSNICSGAGRRPAIWR